MLLTTFIDVLEGIFGIALLIGMFYGFAWIMALLSKASGKTFVRHGRVMYTPDDFDNINKLPKDLAVKFKQTVQKLPGKIQSLNKVLSGDKVTDKLKALSELTELRDKGALTESEFNILKERIMQQ